MSGRSIFLGTRSFRKLRLAEQGFSDKMDTVQKWYDGYCFGNSQSMYCPWDVMQYLVDLHESQNARPKKYWIDTSGNDVVDPW